MVVVFDIVCCNAFGVSSLFRVTALCRFVSITSTVETFKGFVFKERVMV